MSKNNQVDVLHNTPRDRAKYRVSQSKIGGKNLPYAQKKHTPFLFHKGMRQMKEIKWSGYMQRPDIYKPPEYTQIGNFFDGDTIATSQDEGTSSTRAY